MHKKIIAILKVCDSQDRVTRRLKQSGGVRGRSGPIHSYSEGCKRSARGNQRGQQRTEPQGQPSSPQALLLPGSPGS